MPILNEHFEPLGNGIKVLVNREHHFSTDTILLANFARPKKSDSAVELGSGCGTIPLLWSRDSLAKKIYAVEIQNEACNLLNKSISENNLCDKIEVICSDLCDLKGKISFGSHDLVVCNPPYKLSGSGITNQNDQKLLARHESACTIDDITLAASKLLQFGGRFCLCQRPERLTDVLQSMRKNRLEPKTLRFVQQRKDKAPKLFLVEGRKDGNKGFMNVMPTLFIEDENGDFSKEMKEIYGCYKDCEV